MIANKAQSLAEYAVLVALIVAALAGINVYLKRGLQARYKTLVDGATTFTKVIPATETTPEEVIIVGVKQYEPYYAQSEQTIDRQQATAYTYQTKGALQRGINSTVAVTDATETTGLNTGADDAWN